MNDIRPVAIGTMLWPLLIFAALFAFIAIV
jgi:hypothetical protein